MKYGLFGKFVAVNGKSKELADILIQASELLKENEDCLHYVVGLTTDTDDVWVSEVWNSKEAHDSSLEPENIRNLIIKARPLIKEMPGGTEYEVLGGKGL